MNWPTRQARPGDKGYIQSTWVKFATSQYPYKLYSQPAREKYSSRVHALIGVCPTLVCVDPKDDDLIYGYINFDHTVRCVHMVYVRNTFRRYGIGKALLWSAFPEPAGLKYTLHTNYTQYLRGLDEYDPYIIEGEV